MHDDVFLCLGPSHQQDNSTSIWFVTLLQVVLHIIVTAGNKPGAGHSRGAAALCPVLQLPVRQVRSHTVGIGNGASCITAPMSAGCSGTKTTECHTQARLVIRCRVHVMAFTVVPSRSGVVRTFQQRTLLEVPSSALLQLCSALAPT